MPLDSIQALRVFVQVVDSGGLSAAGRVLGLAPTLVSRRIGRLEEDLGVRLLQRTTRRLRITDEGRDFYRRSRRILAELDAAMEEVGPIAGEVRGRVRAPVPTMLARLGLMPMVSELLAEHPGLELQVSFTDQPVDLVAGGWDLAVVVGSPPDSTHLVRSVARVSPRLAATPEYLAEAGIPTSPEDLSRHECLRFISDRPQDTWTLHHDGGEERTVPVHGRFESDNSVALGEAMRAGMGIGLCPRALPDDDFDFGRLTPVLPEWSMGSFQMNVLLQAGRNRIPRVRLVADWLTEVLSGLA